MSKDDACYEYPTKHAESQCQHCTFFEPDGHPKTCALVGGGAIEPEGWCELWEGAGQAHDEFKESDHPRGQPGNVGPFCT